MAKDFSKVKHFNGQKGSVPAKTDNTPALIELLKKNMKAIKSALPKHLTAERVARVALNSIRKNPLLCECAPETLCMAIMEASSLGLEIDGRGQAYLVPFWNSKTGTRDVQLIPGYKGLMDLAYRSGNVASIMAEVVGENDKFNVTFGLEPKLEHTPNLTSRGEVIAVYALAVLKDGTKQFVVVSRADLDKVQEASKSANSGPWVTWPNEMRKKTAIKRLCKLLPSSPEIQRATALDDMADAGIAQSLAETVIDIPVPSQEQEAAEQPAQQAIEAETQSTGVEIDVTPAPEKEKAEIKQEQPAQENQEAKKVDDSYTFECPSTNKQITEDKCTNCKSRAGCPAWDF